MPPRPGTPRVFSFHEVFHVLVVAGSGAHYLLLSHLVARMPWPGGVPTLAGMRRPLLLGVWMLAVGAQAAPVPVANAGFEELYLGSNLPAQYGGDVPTGSFPTGPPPAGWSAWYDTGSPVGGEFIGVLNPGTTADHDPAPPCFPEGAPEGDNVVLLYQDGDAGGQEYGVEQALGVLLEAHTTYTLSVDVGNIATCAGLVVPYTSTFDLDGFPGYRVQLLAGGELVAEDDDGLAPGEGEFLRTTLVFHSGTLPDQEGEELSVRLVNKNQPDVGGVSGLEVDFDDVQLDASPSVGVVPISPVASAAVAGLLLVAGAAVLARRGAGGV